MFKKILYIGAGDDIKPLNIFPYSHFVYIDSLPRNSYGYPYYYRGFYKENFKQNIVDNLTDISFNITLSKKFTNLYNEINITNLDSELVKFIREEGETQALNYYFSTGVPENLYGEEGKLNQELINDISECDTILIKGHWPNEAIIDYINKPFHFIGSEITYFPDSLELEEEDCKNTILYHIIKYSEYVLSYSYLTLSGQIYTFPNYTEFYRHYKTNKEE